ncbi:MAG: hypothetical protein IKZ19_06385 [Clostridia bacterium]|nr:hypothetical protein [Clostridia bacterium]
MENNLDLLFTKALSTARKKDQFETQIREAEEKIASVGIERERLLGLVIHHKTHRKGARPFVSPLVLIGAALLLWLLTSPENGITTDPSGLIAAIAFVSPGFIIPLILMLTFFRSERRHKKLAAKYEAELKEVEETAPRLLAGYRDELDSITRKAKEFWSLEKENLAVFPPQHRNLNSLTVIAQVARELKINNLEQALAFGEMRLQNQELSKNADELRQKVDELNKTVDNLNNTVQKKNNTGTAIVGGVILHAVIDSIFDN